MSEGSEQAILNTIGHAAGVLIFGIFLYLLFQQRFVSRLRQNGLPVLAATLALLWNLASFIVLVLGSNGAVAERLVAAFGFSVLSILPAVLLRLCLRDRFPSIIRAGYCLSIFAVTAHVVELFHDSAAYHRIGLAAITAGFGMLTAIAVLRVFWSAADDSRPLTSRILATMSLFLFAMSFGHFGDGHAYEAWSAELVVHHAGIPFALFVLLQDFRFVLLDAFVRFLVNGLMAALFGGAIVAAVPGMSPPMQIVTAGLLVGAFAASRHLFQRFLLRMLFRQPDPEATRYALRALESASAGEQEYVPLAFDQIAALMSTRRIDAQESPAGIEDLVLPCLAIQAANARDLSQRGIRVIVPIRAAHGETQYVYLGERRGGQPYLSGDLELLARLAADISEHLEQLRRAEVQRLVSQAELKALQAQINPHFLFNALNTLYGVVPREASGARNIVLNLADIFRYFLRTDKTFMPVEEELRIVRAYLAIEQARLGEKLKTQILVDESTLRSPIPVLSIQPLVENAIKHGVAVRLEGGAIRLEVRREQRGIRISVHDTGPGFGASRNVEGCGVGLKNVSRRLTLCYGHEGRLQIQSGVDGSDVSFLAPLSAQGAIAS